MKKFALSDKLTKLAQSAQILSLSPELLEFLAKSTNSQEMIKELLIRGLASERTWIDKNGNKKVEYVFKKLLGALHPDGNPGHFKKFSEELYKKIGNLNDPSQIFNDLSEDFTKLFPKATGAAGTAGEAAGAAKATGTAGGTAGTAGEAAGAAKATGTAGEAAGAAKATGTAGEAAGAAGEAAGAAGEAAGAAKATAQAEGVMAKALANPTFQKILGMFQKAAPAMRWLPPVAVAIDLATKALTKPDELDGFDFGKLVSGMALIPPVATAIAGLGPIGVAILAIANVGAFGGLDVARFATDPKKGLDLFGVNMAVKDEDYDKAIDKSIQFALAKLNVKKTFIKTAQQFKTRNDKIIFLSYLLSKCAEKDLIENHIKLATNNPRFKFAQTTENYFTKSGIDPASYTGTADQNERLRKAINPSSPDFATAFEKKFGTFIKTPSERIPYLNGTIQSQSPTQSEAGQNATGQNATSQTNSDFYEFLSNNSQIQSTSLAGIASSIKRNVDTVAQADFTQFKLSASDEKSLQTWIQSQVRGAEQYKTESTTTFSGLGIGESRKNEVTMITESMAKIAQIKQKFKAIVSGGGQSAQQPVQQRTSGGIFRK